MIGVTTSVDDRQSTRSNFMIILVIGSLSKIFVPSYYLVVLTWLLGSVEIIASKLDDVIKWKHFPRYWPFVRGIHRSPVNSPHKGQWRGALMFSLICVWINGWVNNREAGDFSRYRAHYDVTVMTYFTTHQQRGDFIFKLFHKRNRYVFYHRSVYFKPISMMNSHALAARFVSAYRLIKDYLAIFSEPCKVCQPI